VASLKRSTIDHSRPQAPAPALHVARAHGEVQAEYGVEEIRSWRRNPEEGGRIEYEVKWEDDEEHSWEPEASFRKGGKEILEEFKERDAQLQRELAAEKETGKPRPGRKRRKRQAWVMEVEDGAADLTVFEADDWED
jgi:hypothetical protein